jgi:hypothetical protein
MFSWGWLFYVGVIKRLGIYKKKIEVLLHAEVLLREKNKTEVKVSGLVTRLARLTTELEDEKQLNRSLRQNQVRVQTQSLVPPPPL